MLAFNEFDDARLKKIQGAIVRNGSATSSLSPTSLKCRGANP